MLENVDIIFGPSSVKYGSDALGGVVHYHTNHHKSTSGRQLLQRYSSVNNGINLITTTAGAKGSGAYKQ